MQSQYFTAADKPAVWVFDSEEKPKAEQSKAEQGQDLSQTPGRIASSSLLDESIPKTKLPGGGGSCYYLRVVEFISPKCFVSQTPLRPWGIEQVDQSTVPILK